jgi:hypothetical protein
MSPSISFVPAHTTLSESLQAHVTAQCPTGTLIVAVRSRFAPPLLGVWLLRRRRSGQLLRMFPTLITKPTPTIYRQTQQYRHTVPHAHDHCIEPLEDLVKMRRGYHTRMAPRTQRHRALTARRLQIAPSHDNLRAPVKGSVTVTLLHDNFIRQTPSIMLTSTPDVPPTMDINTWDILGLHIWPAADVHITLFQKARKQHKRGDECSDCRKAARKNRKYIEKMTEKRIPLFDLDDYWADREAWEQRTQEFEAGEKAAEED